MVAPHAPIELWELDDPELEAGSVLLETVASEVCGTDVHILHGQLAGVPYPIIPGHVSVGRILECPGVESDALGNPLAPGDVVTFYDVHETCWSCYHCLVARQPNRCPSRKVYGITYSADEGLLGGWSEKIYLKPGVKVFRIPRGVTPDQVIGGGCGLFTGFAAVDRSQLQLGDSVLVQGAGPVGLSAAAFAGLSGASAVYLIGDPESRLELGRSFGVDETFELSGTTMEERKDHVMSLTGGRGVDVVIEAAGHPSAIPEGLDLMRDGGKYVIVGHYSDVGPAPLFQFIVTLTVRDDEQLEGTDTVIIEVSNYPPVAIARSDRTSADTYENITFDGSDSYDPFPSTGALSYFWDFDDGEFSFEPVVEHQFKITRDPDKPLDDDVL